MPDDSPNAEGAKPAPATSAATGRRKPSFVPFPRLSAAIGYGVISIALFLLLFEIASFAGLRWADRRRAREFTKISGPLHCRGTGEASPCAPRMMVDYESASSAFEGYSWAEEMWRDFRENVKLQQPRVPMLEWQNSPFHSKWVNNDDTPLGRVRRTIVRAAPCTGKPLKIWMLGASALYGYGLPDQETIASGFGDQITTTGTCAEVVNLAVPGYTTTQEVVQLLLLLKQGKRPDVVVMFDGYNDLSVGLFQGSPRTTMDFDASTLLNTPDQWPWVRHTNSARLATALLRRFAIPAARRTVAPDGDIVQSRMAAGEITVKVRATLDVYQENCGVVRKLGEMYGFRPFFFWQPSLDYGKKPLVPFERAEFQKYDSGSEQVTGSAIRAGYEEAKARARRDGGFVFLGDIFDAIDRPIYIDDVHFGPLGSRIVGQRIAEEILGKRSSNTAGN